MTTRERLADAIELAGGPLRLVRRARRGYYSDFESDSETPKPDLVNELHELQDLGVPIATLIQQVTAGEYDDTVQEARAWLAGSEGFRTLRIQFPAISRQKWKDILGVI
ncbi:MAG: hypothetical protein ACRDL4_05280 [Thermoleophilaceae bacterium]